MTSRQLCISSILCTFLMSVAASVSAVPAWLAVPAAFAGLILVPGTLLAVIMRIRALKPLEYLMYSVGLGLTFLILGGLAMNWLLPHMGVPQPLAVAPLTVFFAGANLVLAAGAYFFNREAVLPYRLAKPDARNLTFALVPAAFLAMSILGSIILNNSGTGTLTLAMLFCIAVYAIAVACLKRPLQGWAYASGIYFISLSLLFMYSLRSSHILGWDINLEYGVFLTTLQNMVWKMSYYPSLDYNACVSITILPTIFKQMMHVSSEYVFKAVFQMLFAFTPVIVFAFARRYLRESFAFLAAFLFLSQTWFFEQMPALIRQEAAFIFYILLVMVLFDRALSRRIRYALLILFTAGIILSHYSTAYVWIALMCAVLAISYIVGLVAKSQNRESAMTGIAMLAASVAMIFVWQVVLTHTAGKVTKFVTNDNGPGLSTSTIAAVTASTSSGTLKIPVAAALFSDSQSGADRNLLLAEENADLLYRDRRFAQYPDAGSSGYKARAVDGRAYVPTSWPKPAAAALALLAQAARFAFVDLLPLAGIAAMCLALYRRRSEYRDHDFLVLSIASCALIVLMILVPYLQAYYNFTRLYLQMFLVLSTVAMIGAEAVLAYVPRHRTAIAAVMAAFVFCSLSGALDQISGGQARITLDQPPSTLDTFYMHDDEIAAVRWLVANRDPSYLVHADVVANLRLKSFANMGSDSGAIFPETINPRSYVFMDRLNAQRGEAFIAYENNLSTYNYPVDFIDSHKDLIYSTGGSKIYK